MIVFWKEFNKQSKNVINYKINIKDYSINYALQNQQKNPQQKNLQQNDHLKKENAF